MRSTLMPIFKHSTGLDHSQTLDLSLWFLQAVLALFFGSVGYLKLATPMTELAMTMPWTNYVSSGMVRMIGVCEMLGALGLLLPALFRRETYLVPLASLGLAVIMVLAVGFHLLRAELPVMGAPIFLGLVALFVAWGRYYKEPIKAA